VASTRFPQLTELFLVRRKNKVGPLTISQFLFLNIGCFMDCLSTMHMKNSSRSDLSALLFLDICIFMILLEYDDWFDPKDDKNYEYDRVMDHSFC
jgi:hypothetical protein